MRLPRWVLGVKVTPSWEVRRLKAKRHPSVSNSRLRTSSGVDSAIGFDSIGYPHYLEGLYHATGGSSSRIGGVFQ